MLTDIQLIILSKCLRIIEHTWRRRSLFLSCVCVWQNASTIIYFSVYSNYKLENLYFWISTKIIPRVWSLICQNILMFVCYPFLPATPLHPTSNFCMKGAWIQNQINYSIDLKKKRKVGHLIQSHWNNNFLWRINSI